MKQTISAPKVPTANIAVNKSRLKVYKNAGELPTYYLQKGQEFQIELANPTTNVVMAKVSIDGRIISQGGLVLNPGQRVFLERYLDVAKKFLFDTYEVSDSEEMKAAIANNGDIKIEFFKEEEPYYLYTTAISTAIGLNTYNGTGGYYTGTSPYYTGTSPEYLTNTGSFNTSSYVSDNITNSTSFNFSDSNLKENKASLKRKRILSGKKSIETGRVEQGSNSSQKFEYVNKNFNYFPFHTIEYKLLPVSQKINTIDDINVKVYCTNCGSKLGKTDNFCSQCGTKK